MINTLLRKIDRYWVLTQDDQTIKFPSTPLFDGILEGLSKMLQVHIDDAGVNPRRAMEYCSLSGKLFAGASELCHSMANDYEKDLNL